MGGGGAGGGSLTNNLAGASVSTSAPLHQLWYEEQRKCTWIKTETQHSRHSAIPQSDYPASRRQLLRVLGGSGDVGATALYPPLQFPLNFPPTCSTSLPEELGVPSQSPAPLGRAYRVLTSPPASVPGAAVNITQKMLDIGFQEASCGYRRNDNEQCPLRR